MTGYVVFSVIAAQVPTAAEWNVIGDNQALFNAEFDARWDTWHTLSDGATVTVDLNDGYDRFFKLTIGGNRTIAFSNIPTNLPQTIMIEVKQGGTGNKQLAFPAGSDYEFHEVPVLSDTAGHFDLIVIVVTASAQYRVIHAGRDMY